MRVKVALRNDEDCDDAYDDVMIVVVTIGMVMS